jgi:hypothetical protein
MLTLTPRSPINDRWDVRLKSATNLRVGFVAGPAKPNAPHDPPAGSGPHTLRPPQPRSLPSVPLTGHWSGRERALGTLRAVSRRTVSTQMRVLRYDRFTRTLPSHAVPLPRSVSRATSKAGRDDGQGIGSAGGSRHATFC